MSTDQTTIYSLSLAQARRRRGPIMPSAVTNLTSALAEIGFPVPLRFTHFHLRRRRKGIEVWVNDWGKADGGFNLSAMMDVWPPSYVAARQWITAWGAANGHDMREVKKQ